MKKIFGILLVTILALSCSEDDQPYNPGEETGDVLLHKMVVTNASGQSVTSLYNYDGNTITSISHSDGITENYNYNGGGALSEIRYYQNGSLIQKSTFEYNTSGGFAAVVHMYYDVANPANNHAERLTYAISGQDVTVIKYLGDEQSQTVEDESYVLKLIGNNITAITGDIEASYDFDYQPSPLSNATGYAIMYLTNLEGGLNNIIGGTVEGVAINANYNYNPDGFPADAEVTTGGQSYTITYTY